MRLTTLLYVYVGGLVLKTWITAGFAANPSLKSNSDVGQAFLNVVIWPLLLVFSLYKWVR